MEHGDGSNLSTAELLDEWRAAERATAAAAEAAEAAQRAASEAVRAAEAATRAAASARAALVAAQQTVTDADAAETASGEAAVAAGVKSDRANDHRDAVQGVENVARERFHLREHQIRNGHAPDLAETY